MKSAFDYLTPYGEAREHERSHIEMLLRLEKAEAIVNGQHELAAGFDVAIKIVEGRRKDD